MSTENYYAQNAREFYNNTVDLDMTELYRPFLELIPAGGHILDAGCGSGRDSLYFTQKGYRVTAFDSCQELAAMASRLINKKVQVMRFQELNFHAEFDGTWACASLLHVGREEIDGVMKRLSKALKPGGVMYASFKYGNGEEVRKGRLFNCYEEQSFRELLAGHPEWKLLQSWQTADVRPGREDDKWLNVLAGKSVEKTIFR